MSELTPTNAQRAVTLVGLKYRRYLTTPLPDTSAYKFYKLTEGFDTVFHSIYTKTFRTANLAIFGTDKITSDQINGFVTPDDPPSNRVIYLNLDSTTANFGTLVHETIHAVSHSSFYPTYYCTAGLAPAVVEGITEYLTRKCSPTVAMSRRSYQAWYEATEAWVGPEGSPRYQQMVDWIFRGRQPLNWPVNDYA
ncbi:hypothetical protein FHP25_20835 [Vineibacter terrae]|uniref:Uncharacterized protein n=1 Tax=Vineibacter terrae TaxID=2586908 RepID=A0A5C8PIV6_9HYPH|nr:hypothetical protein [Vineibacter terrae]TXL73624.1 hypothetical protein FHP25_20835 [Vineibacter terrae]